MKPRNDLERKLVKMASRLPAITEKQKEWAFRYCFEPIAVYWTRSRKVKCLCCGAETRWPKPFLDSFIDVDEYYCEECNRSMRMVDEYRYSRQPDRAFFSVLTTFEGMQVVRTFEAIRENYTHGKPTRYAIHDVYQNWITPEGKEVITGVPHTRTPNFISFSYGNEPVIKKHNPSTTGYYHYDDLFDVCGNYFYPSVRLTPLVRRNGWRKELLNFKNSVSLVDVICWLLKSPTAEMLCKTGQLDLFRYMVREVMTEFDFLHSVRIANRRGYIVNDAQMWTDMLQMAERLGMDTHSPKICCPENLEAEHDRIMHRYNRMRAKQLKAEDLTNAVKDREKYLKEKGRFLGILIVGEGIRVSVIPSVDEVWEEGESMHHCVFANQYYKKDTSLLLTARDEDGNRFETVELSLSTFKVLQSRGRCNQNTPRHDDIVRLVETNAGLFRKAQIS